MGLVAREISIVSTHGDRSRAAGNLGTGRHNCERRAGAGLGRNKTCPWFLVVVLVCPSGIRLPSARH